MNRQLISAPQCELLRFDSPEALAKTAARDWLDVLNEPRSTGSPFAVALSGGRIARTFFDAARELFSNRRDLLSNVHFFWADERCVPPTDSESNYALAASRMLKPLGVLEEAIHRIRGENDPVQAAQEAALALSACCRHNAQGRPVLDLAFLGMGEDGHVASLFPGEEQKAVENPDLFRPVVAAKPPPHRITVGYPVLADADRAWVLVSGEGKQKALSKTLDGTDVTPFRRVLCSRSATRVYTDISLGKTSDG